MAAAIVRPHLKKATFFLSPLNCRWCFQASTSRTLIHQTRFHPLLDGSRNFCESTDGEGKPKIKDAKYNIELAKPGRTIKPKDDDSGSSSSESNSGSDSSSDEEEIDPKLVAAVDSVAEVLKGDQEQTKSELLQQLRDHKTLTQAQMEGQLPPGGLSSLISELKVQSSQDLRRERVPWKDRMTGGDKKLSTKQMQQHKGARSSALNKIKLYSSPTLGIFVPPKSQEITESEPSPKSIFNEVEQEEREQKINFPPVNAFDEMIRWTKEGKLWHFPIDNEQGLHEETEVGFHEHVFLDHLLKDFPKKGPVRHFMELVITGLSKNSYITVQQKHDHVAWYKDYFKDKYALIDELTVVDKNKEIN